MKKILTLCVLLLLPVMVTAQTTDFATVFTYEGYLEANGIPVNDSCAMQFALFDAVTGGNQIATTQIINPVIVTDGIFTVQLDFGVDAFNNIDHYLEITVNCGDGDEVLSPRQAIIPVPYALSMYGLRTIPNTFGINIIGGDAGNSIQNGAVGAIIAGGGNSFGVNTIYSEFGVISGGSNNVVGVDGESNANQGYGVIGGGRDNVANSVNTTVGGGGSNQAIGGNATVAGGFRNEATAVNSSVGGGDSNRSIGDNTTVGGGFTNTASGFSATIAGGLIGIASGGYAAIGGGESNQATGSHATVSGGNRNRANADSATVSGGQDNKTFDNFSTVSGGDNNRAGSDDTPSQDPTNAQYATIGGGQNNVARAIHATVGGGGDNFVGGNHGTVAGGIFNNASGTLASIGGGNANEAFGAWNTIAGGDRNRTNDDYSSIGGGLGNDAIGTGSTIAGGIRNFIHGQLGTVAGGGNNDESLANIVYDDYGTIGGGTNNRAGSNENPLNDGTPQNTTNAPYVTIGGGHANLATADSATIGGGDTNLATGAYATIPGGRENVVSGDYGFATGRTAQAIHTGAFVWADSRTAAVASPTSDTFSVSAQGGIWLGTGVTPVLNPSAFISTDTGAYLSSSGVWTNASDRNLKTDFMSVDAQVILDTLAELDLTSWRYLTDEDTRHIGVMAQDFYAAFGYGSDDTSIGTVDMDGVLVASVQALHEQNQALSARIEALEARQSGISPAWVVVAIMGMWFVLRRRD